MMSEAIKVRLDADLRGRLEAAAEADRRPLSNLVRLAVERLLDEFEDGAAELEQGGRAA
jgi:predicted transcriptional regulator